MTTTKKTPMSRQIAEYIRANPNAKADEVAKALGTTAGYVYTITHHMKRKAAKKVPITKKVIDERLKLAKAEGQKNMVRVHLSTSNRPFDEYITMHKDDVTKLTPEQTERIVSNLGQPRMRMQSGITMIEPKHDNVNHPAHYKVGGMETIDFIEAKGLGYNLGNVVKYITRADHKGNLVEDLKKARWYLNREISKLDGAEN